ncbi:MAG: hypothetical protein IPK52_13395 [Chloroflexi bacterium]|nr:hypothetical protein [Chloroflexota bacterium]
MRTLLALAVAMLLTVTISAQRTPVPEPDPLRCTPEGLRDYYTGLVGEGKIALDSPSSDIEVSSEVLGILYDAGKSLQERMLLCGYIPDDIASLPIGEDATLERVLEVLDTLSADPLRGQLLYLGQDRSSQNQTLGCSGCHESVNPIGPTTEGTWTRWDEQYRLAPGICLNSLSPISPPNRSCIPTPTWNRLSSKTSCRRSIPRRSASRTSPISSPFWKVRISCWRIDPRAANLACLGFAILSVYSSCPGE